MQSNLRVMSRLASCAWAGRQGGRLGEMRLQFIEVQRSFLYFILGAWTKSSGGASGTGKKEPCLARAARAGRKPGQSQNTKFNLCDN